MKRFFTCLAIVLITVYSIAQAPQIFKYQTVVRNAGGEILANQSVRFRISIHDGTPTGPIVYQEIHPPMATNQFGLANLFIGDGSPTIGSFPLIDWGNEPKFMEVEMDPTGGTNYVSMGISQLFSVPYALYAERSAFGDSDWVINGDNMFADVTGNVGIGTPNPENARLEVVGDMVPGIDASSFMANGIKAFSSAGGGYAAGYFNAVNPGTYGIWTQSSEYDALYATTYSPTAAAIRASGDNAGIFNGKVGIGTSSPTRLLHVYGTANPRILVESSADQAPELNLTRGSTTHALYINSNNDLVFYQAGDRVTFKANGNVGIGTSDPTGRLHISSSTSSWGMLKLENSNTGQNEVSIAFREGSDVTGTNTWLAGVGLYGNPGDFIIGRGGVKFAVDYDGNVGIGTSSPSFKLDIDFGDALIQGPQSFDANGEQATLYLGTLHHYLRAEYGYGIKIGTYASADALNIAEGSGFVGIGTTTPSEKLTVKGNIRVESASSGLPVVELGEGLDYAEGFDLSNAQEIESGNVLIIDPENPGELTLSQNPYDSRVAGIVAGANDLGSGVKLGAGQFDCNVALAGRVYCNVDATYGAVAPGDLLTTSPTPGFAMLVKDHKKAQGAILGKAMEPMEKGRKGQILVLVTLQ